MFNKQLLKEVFAIGYKVWAIGTMLVILLSSCAPAEHTTDIEELPNISASQTEDIADPSSEQGTETLINSLLESSYPIDPINIEKIEKAAVINAAWGDENSIYFIARTFPHSQVYKDDWSSYPIEIYHYDNDNKELNKVFEYYSDYYYPYLYIQVQDNGNIVLKHNKGFTIISDKDFSVVSEIAMQEHYINCNISYDGTKIAVADQENKVTILDAATLLPLQSVQIPKVAYIQAPTWSTDSKNVFTFASTYEFVDLTYKYNVESKKLQEFDFTEHLSTYDNDAFLLGDGQLAARMDHFSVKEQDDNIGIQIYDFDSQESSFWFMGNYYIPYCKSISEKGYMVAHVFEEYHKLYIANIHTERLVITEQAKRGGAKYPPVWARDQERAIVLLTMEGKDSVWAAAMVNCPTAVE